MTCSQLPLGCVPSAEDTCRDCCAKQACLGASMPSLPIFLFACARLMDALGMQKTRGGFLARLGSASLVCGIGALGCDGVIATDDVGTAPTDTGPRPDVYVPPGVDAALDAFAVDAFTELDDAYVPPGVDAALDAARSPGPTCAEPPPPSPLVALRCDPIAAPR